jgi:hypothetical protein
MHTKVWVWPSDSRDCRDARAKALLVLVRRLNRHAHEIGPETGMLEIAASDVAAICQW